MNLTKREYFKGDIERNNNTNNALWGTVNNK